MLRRVLFQSLIFLMPTQLSLYLWPEWAHVFGIRVDYLSPTIFLTDLLAFSLITLWVTDKSVRKKRFQMKTRWAIGIVGLLVLVLINILSAQRPPVAFIKWLKIFELSLVALYITKERKFQFREWIVKPLMYSVILFSLVAFFQFFYQRTLGGPLRFFGERSFSTGTPGIALFSFFGKQLLRPYSTFAHPNALAGFMLVSLVLLLGVELKGKREGLVKKIAILFASMSIAISLSRTAWLAAFVAAAFYLVVCKNKLLFKKAIYFLFLLLLFSSLLLPFISRSLLRANTGFVEEAERRLQLAESAGKIIATEPLFGIGLGNFVIKLPEASDSPAVAWWLQPVHNIFLLVFTETGGLGLLIFLYLIFKSLDNSLRTNNRRLTISLLAILLTGFLDHYWLTLQQNQLLLALVLGLSFKKKLIKGVW